MYFEVTRRVRFADVDPAGIVFYPRYFEMINAVVEDWFEAGLDYGLDQMIRCDGIGIPLAHIDVNFEAPSRLDDTLVLGLSVSSVGRSAIKLKITARSGDEVRFIAHPTLVHIDIAKHRPTRIPDTLKTRMLDFKEAA
jgi:4-hydroxybenzoyl-CoA thioesterase